MLFVLLHGCVVVICGCGFVWVCCFVIGLLFCLVFCWLCCCVWWFCTVWFGWFDVLVVVVGWFGLVGWLLVL